MARTARQDGAERGRVTAAPVVRPGLPRMLAGATQGAIPGGVRTADLGPSECPGHGGTQETDRQAQRDREPPAWGQRFGLLIVRSLRRGSVPDGDTIALSTPLRPSLVVPLPPPFPATGGPSEPRAALVAPTIAAARADRLPGTMHSWRGTFNSDVIQTPFPRLRAGSE